MCHFKCPSKFVGNPQIKFEQAQCCWSFVELLVTKGGDNMDGT
jgi:hypothetical protein